MPQTEGFAPGPLGMLSNHKASEESSARGKSRNENKLKS